MMQAVLFALLALLVLLLLAVVGAALRPGPRLDDSYLHAFGDQPETPSWAATRCGFEDLANCRSPEVASGVNRTAGGRMYAAPPAGVSSRRTS